jgi:hypothetical protein
VGELLPDLANGIFPILLKNLQPNAAQVTLSMVAATPKPRIVKLKITAEGEVNLDDLRSLALPANPSVPVSDRPASRDVAQRSRRLTSADKMNHEENNCKNK